MKPNHSTESSATLPPRLHPLWPLLLVAGLAFQSQANDQNSQSDPAAFTIQFNGNHVEVSGAIASPGVVTLLSEKIRNARPGCQIQNDRLSLDPAAAQLPPAADLEGLLTELALSTRGGTIRISKNLVSIWGLTDSLVSHAAIQIRLEHLSGAISFRIENGIEVVSTEEFASRLLPLSVPRNPELPQLAIRD